MNKKIKSITKLFILIIFINLLFINFYKTQADALPIERIVEEYYKEVQTDEGTFYIRKSVEEMGGIHTGYKNSQIAYKEENKEIVKIIKEKAEDYFEKQTLEEYPKDQRIQEDFDISVRDIYSITETEGYKVGDDIVALISFYSHPIHGDNEYWTENFTNNELFYDKWENRYNLWTYYSIRLSMNQETNEYEIAYMGLEPENFDEYLTVLEEKGINLKEIDVDRVLNVKYTDDIKVVPSSETSTTSAEKVEYNSSQIEEISNTSNLIRGACIGLLVVIIFVGIVKVWKNKN